MNKTLVLNADYSPMQIVDWKRAVTLFVEGTVFITQPYLKDGKPVLIGTASDYRIERPAIIVAKKYVDMSKKRVKLSRVNLLYRDDFTCQYTGAKLPADELDIDHVIPKSRGGKNTWENMVTCSKNLNNKKSDRTAEEMGYRLIAQPRRPHWSNLLMKKIKHDGPEIWVEFLKGMGYT